MIYPNILKIDNTFNIKDYEKNREYYDYHFQNIFKKKNDAQAKKSRKKHSK